MYRRLSGPSANPVNTSRIKSRFPLLFPFVVLGLQFLTRCFLSGLARRDHHAPVVEFQHHLLSGFPVPLNLVDLPCEGSGLATTLLSEFGIFPRHAFRFRFESESLLLYLPSGFRGSSNTIGAARRSQTRPSWKKLLASSARPNPSGGLHLRIWFYSMAQQGTIGVGRPRPGNLPTLAARAA